jgi:hypothetical protein
MLVGPQGREIADALSHILLMDNMVAAGVGSAGRRHRGLIRASTDDDPGQDSAIPKAPASTCGVP